MHGLFFNLHTSKYIFLKLPKRTAHAEESVIKKNPSFKDTKLSKAEYREALEQQIQEKKSNHYATKRNSNQDIDRVVRGLDTSSSRSRVLNQEEYREALNRQMEEKNMYTSRGNVDEPAPTSLPLPSMDKQGRPGMKLPKVTEE